MIPDYEAIESLHRKYAPDEDAFRAIFTHSKIVAEIAAQLIESKPEISLDKELVEAACLLHDIGAYESFKNGDRGTTKYIQHGLIGEKILNTEQIDARICRIASHHTGVGLSKAEIIKNDLPIPPADYFAETDEEKIVMYADKFHSKTPKFNSYDSYLKFTAKYGEEHATRFKQLAEKFGIPELESLSQKYNHPLI